MEIGFMSHISLKTCGGKEDMKDKKNIVQYSGDDHFEVALEDGREFSVYAEIHHPMDLVTDTCAECGLEKEGYSVERQVSILELFDARTMVEISGDQELKEKLAALIGEFLAEDDQFSCNDCIHRTMDEVPEEQILEDLRKEEKCDKYEPRHKLK